MSKKTSSVLIISIILILCQLTGCRTLNIVSESHMDKIEGEYECEFRVGRNAQFIDRAIETDVVFDKDRFVDLINEYYQYDPNYLKDHLDDCYLKINADEDPEAWDEIESSAVNIRVLYDEDKSAGVTVHQYESGLYFFVLCMGSRSQPDEIGYYYMKLSEDMTGYWQPILDQVREDAALDQLNYYGSFTVEHTYSYDREYFAENRESGDDTVVTIIDYADNIPVSVLSPCPSSGFRGVCWANDSYDLWIQSTETGTVCYSMTPDGVWELNEDAVQPDYIINRQGSD